MPVYYGVNREVGLLPAVREAAGSLKDSWMKETGLANLSRGSVSAGEQSSGYTYPGDRKLWWAFSSHTLPIAMEQKKALPVPSEANTHTHTHPARQKQEALPLLRRSEALGL